MVRERIVKSWGNEKIVLHGEVFYPHEASGFIATSGEETIGLITYRDDALEFEVLTLDSWWPSKGIGSALLDRVIHEGHQRGRKRVWLITTNNNLDALRFYQKRGFQIVTVHAGAVDKARQLKPEIPFIGENGIPIHDEIELELIL